MESKIYRTRKKNYEITEKNKIVIVGAVGYINNDKSFILSKICGVNLQVGTKSQGIRNIIIKYAKIENEKPAEYIMMNSAGFENLLL